MSIMERESQSPFRLALNLLSQRRKVFVLKTFGGASIEGENGPLTGRAAHKRRIALLALLAASRTGSLSRDRITGYLWPESGNARARALLSESLYVLRKELGEDAFAAIGDELTLNPQVVTSDVAEFRAAIDADDLQRAVAVYRGAFLDGFSVADAAEFERWVEAERQHLALAYCKALEHLAEAAEAENDLSQAVDYWRQLARHDPYSSPVALRLMQALTQMGDRAAALQYASVHTALLRDDLGIEPSGDVLAFAVQLRNGSPGIPEMDSVGSTGGAAGSSPEARNDAEPLIAPPGSAEAAVPDGDEVDSAEGTGARYPVQPTWRSRRWMKYAGSVLAALAVLGGLLLTASGRRGQNRATELYNPSRVAVLYFDDHSPGQELGYLASGLTEHLIHQLSQVEGIDVVSRNGVKPFRISPPPVDSLARLLRVGSIVEGSIQRSGDRLRVTVKLVDVATAKPVASRVIEHSIGELFALEDEVGSEVAGFLRRRLGRALQVHALQRGTRSVEARDVMLRGLEMKEAALELAERPDSIAILTAAQMLGHTDNLLLRAEQLDPHWMDPVVERGRVWMERALRATGEARDSAFMVALRQANRVLTRQPGHAKALELRGWVQWERWWERSTAAQPATDTLLVAAERDLRAAVGHDPSLATAWSTLSQYLRYTGRAVEADIAARRALQEDAFLAGAAQITDRLIRSAMNLGRYEEAREWCERGRSEHPEDWHFVDCHLTLLARDPAETADPDSARALERLLDRMDPPSAARSAGRAYHPIFRSLMVGAVFARAGINDSAAVRLERAHTAARVAGDFEESFLYDEAYLRLLMGDTTATYTALRLLLARRPGAKEFIRGDPLFAPLSIQPAFQEITGIVRSVPSR